MPAPETTLFWGSAPAGRLTSSIQRLQSLQTTVQDKVQKETTQEGATDGSAPQLSKEAITGLSRVTTNQLTLELRVKQFRAGQLSSFAHNWKQFTSDAWVFSILSGADIELLRPPCQAKEPKPIKFTAEEDCFLDMELDKLLARNVSVRCNKQHNDLVSNIFLTRKKDEFHRVILYLRRLNQSIHYNHFKMEISNQQ